MPASPILYHSSIYTASLLDAPGEGEWEAMNAMHGIAMGWAGIFGFLAMLIFLVLLIVLAVAAIKLITGTAQPRSERDKELLEEIERLRREVERLRRELEERGSQ